MRTGGASVSIVCVFNDPEVRRACLDRSLEAHPHEAEVEYLPIDNVDGSFATAGAALNIGASLARHELRRLRPPGRLPALALGARGWPPSELARDDADRRPRGARRHARGAGSRPNPRPRHPPRRSREATDRGRQPRRAPVHGPRGACSSSSRSPRLRSSPGTRTRSTTGSASDRGPAGLRDRHPAHAQQHHGQPRAARRGLRGGRGQPIRGQLPVRRHGGVLTRSGRARAAGGILRSHRWRYRWLRESAVVQPGAARGRRRRVRARRHPP